MSAPTTPRRQDYLAALREYLREGGEAALNRAYQIGRHTLSESAGMLRIAALHHQALEELLAAGEVEPARLAAASKFLLESLSPCEMMLRGFGETNAALRSQNERLEAEARRIGHALHDEAAQLLAAVYISLDQNVARLPARERTRFAAVRKLLDQVQRQLRRLAHELRPSILDDLGLVPALEFLAEGYAERFGLRVSVRGSTGGRLPPSLETALYRGVQEALNNVAKHAHARRAQIVLVRRNGTVECSIRDDGIGFDPARLGDGRGSLGLIGIRERLSAIGGSLAIDSGPEGTKLRLSAPVKTS